jgi:hypothetical protein
MLSTSAKLLQTPRYPGVKSTQVPRTHSVSQPLPSHVYLWSYRRSKVAKKHVYTHKVDVSLPWCSQLPPNCCKHRGIPESSPHRYPTYIPSHNHYLPMCICDEIGGQKSQKSTLIHTKSTFRCFHALNFRQTAANIEISRKQVHTGTPHTFCLTTTTLKCVFVKQ